MTSQVRPVCNCPEPGACYAICKDKALQTAVAPEETDLDDQFD